MRRTYTRFLFALAALLMLAAQTHAKTDVTWYGHAAFRIVTPSGKVILVDPWISNPLNKNAQADIEKLDRVDLILISHGHADHVGDAVAIAKRTKAKLVSSFDLGQSLAKYGGYPQEQVGFDSQGNIGGWLKLLDGEVSIMITPAVHGSTVTAEGGELHPGGNPTGFVIKVKNGPTIYHTGDTGLFSEMAFLKKHKIDLMLCCIGDHFVMGPEAAADAVKMVGPAQVVPMHFGTFPVLTGTSETFSAELTKAGATSKLHVMQVGQTMTL